MEKRKLGTELSVSAVGLGCMGMTFAYGGQDEADAIRTLHRAVDIGVTFFDTAEVYGPFDNEILVGKAMKGRRDKVVIATKFGFKIADEGEGQSRMVGVDSRPEHVKAVAEASLGRLGIEQIDLFYQHRVDPNVPIEDTVGAMADLVRQGKVKALGLSEASAATIRRAHKVHPIAAIQSEYSLWSRDPEDEVLAVCRELGIGFVPYSPLGRGLLTGTINKPDELGADDWRKTLPRFQAENMDANAVPDCHAQGARSGQGRYSGAAGAGLGAASGRFHRSDPRGTQDQGIWKRMQLRLISSSLLRTSRRSAMRFRRPVSPASATRMPPWHL